MTNNPNIHHRRSIRLKGYDYSRAGLYFITIITKDRECLFGEVSNGEMILNDAGQVADQCWLEIPNHFPNVELHNHVVMPNHVHGIIGLIDPNVSGCLGGGGFPVVDENGVRVGNDGGGYNDRVRAQNLEPLHEPLRGSQYNHISHNRTENRYQNIIPRSIGSIVRGYKIGVTKWFRQNKSSDFPIDRPVWQRNYYEHIIRNTESFQNISTYITNNPAQWDADKFYTT